MAHTEYRVMQIRDGKRCRPMYEHMAPCMTTMEEAERHIEALKQNRIKSLKSFGIDPVNKRVTPQGMRLINSGIVSKDVLTDPVYVIESREVTDWM